MDKKTFYIDMDNTTNDFTSHYVKYYNEIYGKDIHLKREDLKLYYLATLFPGVSEQEAIDIRENIFARADFWQTLPVFDYAKEVLKKLHEAGHEVLFVTAPWPAYLDCGRDKLIWMRKHFPFIDIKNVIFTHHKHLLNSKNSIMFDDSPDYLEKFKGTKVAMDYPFNSHINVDARVKDWYGFEKYLETIGAL